MLTAILEKLDTVAAVNHLQGLETVPVFTGTEDAGSLPVGEALALMEEGGVFATQEHSPAYQAGHEVCVSDGKGGTLCLGLRRVGLPREWRWSHDD